jgi:hypothetical protein
MVVARRRCVAYVRDRQSRSVTIPDCGRRAISADLHGQSGLARDRGSATDESFGRRSTRLRTCRRGGGKRSCGGRARARNGPFNTTTHEGITITLSTASSSGSHGASLATSRIWPARGVRASAHVGTAPARSLRGPAGGSCLRYRLVRPGPGPGVPRIPVDHGNNAWALLPAGVCYCPTRPSTHSRSRSACPQWRAYSSIR